MVRLLWEDKLERIGSWDTLENEAIAWMIDHPKELSTSIVLAGRLMQKPGQESRHVGEQILRKAIALDPNSVDGLRVLTMLLHSQGRDLEAAKLDRQLLALEPNDVHALNSLAWVLSEEMGQYKEALSLAARALKLA